MCKDCLLDPKLDFVFKRIFGNENDPDILIRFLNAIFESTDKTGNYDPIVSITFKNPEITKESIGSKASVLDIKAVTSKGEIISIEIQRQDDDGMVNRMVYYLSKLVAEQLKAGDPYQEVSGSIAIVITNFTIKGIADTHFHNAYRYKNITTNKELTDIQELHFIELAKMKLVDENDVLQLFLQFLKKPNDKTVIKKSSEIKELSRAKEKLVFLSNDPVARQIADEREKALKDMSSQLLTAEAKGRKEGEYNTTLKLIKKNLNKYDDETISDMLDLEVSVVKKDLKKVSKKVLK